MKDTIITARRKKSEIIAFVICLVLGFAFNALSIYIFDTPWNELYTEAGYVLCVSIVFYIIWTVIRLIFSFLIGRRKRAKRAKK